MPRQEKRITERLTRREPIPYTRVDRELKNDPDYEKKISKKEIEEELEDLDSDDIVAMLKEKQHEIAPDFDEAVISACDLSGKCKEPDMACEENSPDAYHREFFGPEIG